MGDTTLENSQKNGVKFKHNSGDVKLMVNKILNSEGNSDLCFSICPKLLLC